MNRRLLIGSIVLVFLILTIVLAVVLVPSARSTEEGDNSDQKKVQPDAGYNIAPIVNSVQCVVETTSSSSLSEDGLLKVTTGTILYPASGCTFFWSLLSPSSSIADGTSTTARTIVKIKKTRTIEPINRRRFIVFFLV